MFIRYDNVTILNANQQILAGPYCGDTNIPPTYTSTGNQATVKFMSDPGATKSGFDISYTCKGGPGRPVYFYLFRRNRTGIVQIISKILGKV